MKFPTVNALEELNPGLVRLAAFHQSDPKLKQKLKQNFLKVMSTAARLWTIKRSLYEPNSDIYIELNSNSFKCATWESLLKDRLPDYRQRTCAQFLLSECTPNERDDWEKTVMARYNIDSSAIARLLSSEIFAVDSRTIRNHFKSLTRLRQPVLLASLTKGEYLKLSPKEIEEYEAKVNSIIEYGSSDALNLISDELSTIAELLLKKINGEQRLFIHTEYIVNQELQDIADDWATELKEIWQQSLIGPITIEYDSASYGNTDEYIVYPVCLYYHQRAFYLCAYGQRPNYNAEFGWYNYRLERISNLLPGKWDEFSISQQLKATIYDGERVKPDYKPEHIQLELDSAYGFDFNLPRTTMLLRFNRNFSDRYIQNTDRHRTFKKVDAKQARSFIQQQLETDSKITDSQKRQMIEILERNLEDTLYKLDYRVGDNNVIMRLRAWCPNVEVIYPWSLRQRMREDMKQTWRLYESDR